MTALELAAEQHMYGAEYLRAILTQSRAPTPGSSAQRERRISTRAMPMGEERDLAEYEAYVANRASVLTEPEARR